MAAVFALLLVLGACSDDDAAVTTTSPSSVATPGLRVLALGDSYTIGESVDAEERWPVVLGRRLESEGFSSVDVEIVARTGWTTSELDAGIDAAAPQGPYDLVTLLIGVNNQFRGLDIDDYRAELVGLVDRAEGFSLGPVLMVSIPDWGITPFGAGYDAAAIAAEIDAFNAVASEEAAARSIPFVDITAISRSDRTGLVADDDLHPSAEQYRLWVEEMIDVVRGLLES